MSIQLDRAGDFKAIPTAWGIQKSENTQSVARTLSSIYSSSLDRVSSLQPQIARGAVGRSLLQAEHRA